ncbi:UDP-glycosyltransferase 86A1 [Striga hermonthica]|uniref:Glycosyltransferase n=1 Tax=Striga hermonthica TaxID=68872 RepID=A0A9N7RHZ0_STRHE|nr:UDP-glycosyltransferase 86A1 [Striga hermonthica]
MENEKKLTRKPHAIMVAIPAQGHLNPFVHLALKLASKGFTVTFVQIKYVHELVSKSHNRNEDDIFAEARDSGLDIRYTTIGDGFPIEFDRLQNYVEYWEYLLSGFSSLVDEVVGKIIESCDRFSSPLLVTDTVYAWPGVIAKKYGIVNVSFWTEPALVFATCYFWELLRENGHFPPKDNHEQDITYIPGIESINTKDLISIYHEADTTTIVHKVLFKAFEEVKKADFILHNTVQELESHTLSTLNENQPTYAIGPISFSTELPNINIPKSMHPETECNQWLASKTRSSVLYISFGSAVHIDKRVIEEIARGVITSGVDFIWAMRPKILSSNDETRVLPVGFEDEVKGRGLIVPWCNQMAVLSHEAVGGFLTHCGWNSILESIFCGVPMICYPVLYDQPTNRKLVVDDWKIGINLCDGGEPVRGEGVGVKIKKLMSGETSNCMRNEMKKIRNIMRGALGESGSSKINLDQFLKDLEEKMNNRKMGININ